MVEFARVVNVRVYKCESISRSTMLFKKRERIKRLQFRLDKLEESKKRLAERNKRKESRLKNKTFLCCSVYY